MNTAPAEAVPRTQTRRVLHVTNDPFALSGATVRSYCGVDFRPIGYVFTVALPEHCDLCLIAIERENARRGAA